MHVGATTKRFLEGAEEINLRKIYKNGTFREFLVDDLNNFLGHGVCVCALYIKLNVKTIIIYLKFCFIQRNQINFYHNQSA